MSWLPRRRRRSRGPPAGPAAARHGPGGARGLDLPGVARRVATSGRWSPSATARSRRRPASASASRRSTPPRRCGCWSPARRRRRRSPAALAGRTRRTCPPRGCTGAGPPGGCWTGPPPPNSPADRIRRRRPRPLRGMTVSETAPASGPRPSRGPANPRTTRPGRPRSASSRGRSRGTSPAAPARGRSTGTWRPPAGTPAARSVLDAGSRLAGSRGPGEAGAVPVGVAAGQCCHADHREPPGTTPPRRGSAPRRPRPPSQYWDSRPRAGARGPIPVPRRGD